MTRGDGRDAAAEPFRTEDDTPAIVPSIVGVYTHSWRVLMGDVAPLLFTGFVVWVVVILGVGLVGQIPTVGPPLAVLYHVLVVNPIMFGAAYAWLMAVRGTTPDAPDLLVPVQHSYLTTVLAGALTAALVAGGLVLFVVPGVVLAVRLAFVPFLVVDEHLGPTAALKASWKRTAGYSWTILGLWLLGITLLLIGLLLFLVGTIPASIIVFLTFAALYASVTARAR